MNGQTDTPNKTDKKISNKKKLGYSIAAILTAIALIAGFSYAWFYNRTDMATLMAIKPPANISILGPGGNEMTSLDLNYTDADKKDGKVTVKRVICVQSAVGDNYKLEIVHTTNLKGLEFKLYKAEPTSDGNGAVTDGGYSYSYDTTPINGKYINQQSMSGSEYKTANNDQHQTNYGTYNNVQAHAEPLYWLADGILEPDTNKQVTLEDKTYNRTYYVCEVTWTETTKETDIFYILAKTAQN